MATHTQKPPRPSFSSPSQRRHSSATVLDYHSALHSAPGTATPPLQAPGSIPFKWEEEPGKPRHSSSAGASLTPPPSMAQFVPYDADPPEFPKHPPASIFDGPHNLARPKFSSSRFFHESQLDLAGGRKSRGRSLFGKLKGSRRETGAGGGNSFSSNSSSESDDGFVQNMGFERHDSFLSHQRTRSTSPHIWATIYGGFKQAVHRKSGRK